MRTGVRSISGTSVGLFAGIGGIELGLSRSGFEPQLLCEIDPHAQAVLSARFPDVPIQSDIRLLDELPEVDVIAGGFPCQDLSQAGRTEGISGDRSGLVGRVFDLLRRSDARPRWLVLENVSFMLSLDRGRAMRYLVDEIEALGMRWAYRVVDSRSFGLPQRRQRVILVASASDDPRGVLFADDAEEPPVHDPSDVACGFYWTEGLRGLGWAVGAVPTLKGGSTIGIPSPPAIRMPDGRIVKPEIRDVERLQGFDADWTIAALTVSGRRSHGARWKLVGNAVSVPVAEWLGHRLMSPGTVLDGHREIGGGRWPRAAWGERGRVLEVPLGMYPVATATPPLEEFLKYPLEPLSARAAQGFRSRTRRSTLRFPDGLLEAVDAHVNGMAVQLPLAA